MTIEPRRTALVVLAAGLSRRFGRENKISALLHGWPLGLHIVDTLAAIPFACRVAVIGNAEPGFVAYGYDVVLNPHAESGMAGSLKLGIAKAESAGVEAALVVLADMPLVPAGHILALLERYDGKMLGTRGDKYVMPPAIFPRGMFPRLMELEGDTGARFLLAEADSIAGAESWLCDIDTQADLGAINRRDA